MATVVSAYYKIPSKFSHERYMDWIANFMNLPMKKLIFTDENSFMSLFERWPPSEFLTYQFLPISEFEMSSHDWTQDLARDHESNHSIELYKIWNEKLAFVRRAIELNPYGTDKFVWTDIGSFRDAEACQRFHTYPAPEKIPDGKIVMLELEPFHESEKVGACRLDERFRFVNRIGGGMIAGSKHGFLRFHRQHAEMVTEAKRLGVFAGKDQSLFAFCILRNPDLFQLVPAPPRGSAYDPWMHLHEYLSADTGVADPFFSILIPLFNGVEFLAECLESVGRQTFCDWELLIGINGHGDGLGKLGILERVKGIVGTDARIRILVQPQVRGKVQSLNDLVKQARGSWICLLDTDDIWAPQKLEEQCKAIRGVAKTACAVGTWCVYFGEMQGAPSLPGGWLDPAQLAEVNPIINSSVSIQRCLAHWKHPALANGIMEDYDLWMRIALAGGKLYNIPKHLVGHRIHSSSAFNSQHQDPTALQAAFRKNYGEIWG